MKTLKSYQILLVIPISLVVVFASMFAVRQLLTENKKSPYQNIFEEIYEDEIKYLQTTQNLKITSIKGIHVNTPPDTTDYKAGLVSMSYTNTALPPNSNIQLSASKGGVAILLSNSLDNMIILNLYEDYDAETKTLKQTIRFETGEGVTISDDRIPYYREQYNLTNQVIKEKFALIDSTFLTDWSKVSDSPYSPSNYGDVKIVNKWEES